MTVRPLRIFGVVDAEDRVVLTFPATAVPAGKVLTVGYGLGLVRVRVRGDSVRDEVHGLVLAAEFVDGPSGAR